MMTVSEHDIIFCNSLNLNSFTIYNKSYTYLVALKVELQN